MAGRVELADKEAGSQSGTDRPGQILWMDTGILEG